jgi:hypothetical protein
MINDLYKTTKGYVIDVYCRKKTVIGDIVGYSFNGERQMTKIRTNDKGSYIEVRQNGKYYGRCYIFN